MSRMQSLLLVLILVSTLVSAPAAWAGVVDADLSITKTDGAASATPGTMVTYTIVGSNAGPSDTTATVTDTFPATLTGCTWSCAASAGSSCTAAGAGNLNDGVNLLNGGNVTYMATCAIDAAATGTLDNTASITGPLNDPNMGDNSATDSNTLTGSADLVVNVVITPDPVGVGEPFTITITVSNGGPSDAANVVVTITLPPGLRSVGPEVPADKATLISTTGCMEDPTGVPTCTIGTIAAGAQANVTVQAVGSAMPGSGDIIVSVASTTADPNGGNNTVTVAQAFEVSIPTLGEWSLLLLALMLTAAALIRMRRQKVRID